MVTRTRTRTVDSNAEICEADDGSATSVHPTRSKFRFLLHRIHLCLVDITIYFPSQLGDGTVCKKEAPKEILPTRSIPIGLFSPAKQASIVLSFFDTYVSCYFFPHPGTHGMSRFRHVRGSFNRSPHVCSTRNLHSTN